MNMWGAWVGLQASIEEMERTALPDTGGLELPASALDESGLLQLRQCNTCSCVLLADAMAAHSET